MRIEVLGQLRVVDHDGNDVTPRGTQQRRAMVALAAASPGAITIDTLEDLLWPDGSPSTNALQALVSKLRKVVAPATIESDGRSYRIGGVHTDLADLDDAIRSGRWVTAESLVNGAPLADLDGHPFAAPIVARVSAMVRSARVSRLTAVVDGPDPSPAIAELEALVVTEPFDEQWWASLMLAHARMGRHAEALDIYQRARRSLVDRLGLEPGPLLRDVEAQVLAGSVSPAQAAPDTSVGGGLPVSVGSFVGRVRELGDLATAIAEHRLVTLVGPGGAGKTTTALEVARRSESVADAALVRLAPVTDRDSAVRAVARAIGLRENEGAATVVSSSDPLDRVCEALRTRDILLVLDNCEHLIAESATIAHSVLTNCPGVRVMATSRESLGVPGEHVYPLLPLLTEEATALFVERADDHGVIVDGRDPEVASLCERLDGLPLAIELAAARLRTMTLPELSQGLDDRFTLLSIGPRLAERRQQTLRAVVDWSHDLLDPSERVVFRRLAAFTGGATASGIRAVCSDRSAATSGISPDAALATVERLVDKSLVRVDRTPFGVRFNLLQTLGDYAREHLIASGEHEQVLIRHAQFVADEVVAARKGLVGTDQPAWFARVGADRANFDAALGTAVTTGDAQLALELVVPIGWYFFMAGELDAGMDALESALACEGPTDPFHRAQALAMFGWLQANGPHVEPALATTSEALSLLDQVDEPFARGLIVNTHAMALFFAGRLDAVQAFVPVLDEYATRSPDRWVRGITGVVLGEFAQFQGRIADAEQLFEASAADFEAEGDRFAYALTITEASEITEMVGDYDRSAELLKRGIELAAEVGFSGHPLAMKARLGNVEVLRGNLDEAKAQFDELIRDAVALGVPWLHSMAQVGLASVHRRRGAFAEAEAYLDAAWEIPRSRSVPYMRSIIQVAKGYLADQRGDRDTALRHQLDGLRTALQLRTPRGTAYSLEGVAGALALSSDDGERRLGAELLGAANTLRRANGGAMPEPERFDVDRCEHRLRSQLGEQAFAASFDEGANADVDALAARALALEPPDPD